jgi:hypothetical protein
VTVVAAALAAHALGMERQFEAREQTVGASEVGRCMRQTFYYKNEGDRDRGAQRDPAYADRWRGAAARGTVFETHYWVPAMRAAYGARLLYAGAEQRTLAQGFLSATPDGLLVDVGIAHSGDEITHSGDRIAHSGDRIAHSGDEIAPAGGDRSLLLECKTVHPNTRLTEPKPAHAFQVQVGLGLVRALTPHRPEHALISYTSASDWSDTREFMVRRDPAVFATARTRALQILTTPSAAALPPEGRIAGGKECGWCPFTGACLGAQRSTVKQSVNVGA